jgi:hypothetical protein
MHKFFYFLNLLLFSLILVKFGGMFIHIKRFHLCISSCIGHITLLGYLEIFSPYLRPNIYDTFFSNLNKISRKFKINLQFEINHHHLELAILYGLLSVEIEMVALCTLSFFYASQKTVDFKLICTNDFFCTIKLETPFSIYRLSCQDAPLCQI